MHASELKERLEKIIEEHGDLPICTTEDHEYWGTLHNYLGEDGVRVSENAQPQGPKSGKSEKAILIGSPY